MLYPHLQPECPHVRRYLIRAHDTAPHEHEGLTLMGYGTIHTADGKRVRWAYFGRP
jgi:hypothetical protein